MENFCLRAWFVSGLAVASVAFGLCSGCSAPPPTIPFSVATQLGAPLGNSKKCDESSLSAVSKPMSKVRLSVRYRDDPKVAGPKPRICDALLDPALGTVEALSLPATGMVDLFVEAFDASNQRVATGATLGVNLSGPMPAIPTVKLLPAEKWSCVQNTDATLGTPVGAAVRLAQHRAFHSATLLPNGQVLFLGGVITNTNARDDAGTNDTLDGSMEPYYLTGLPEVYDPATRRILPVTDASAANSARAFHQAALLRTLGPSKFEIIVVGGLAQPVTGPALQGHRMHLLDPTPQAFRFSLPMTAIAADSEIVIYDASTNPPSLVHMAEPAALLKQAAIFQAGAQLATGTDGMGGGIAVVGGLQPAHMPVPETTILATVRDDMTALVGKVLEPRVGAGLIAINEGTGTTTKALLIGGTGDKDAPTPAPFERLDLTSLTSTSAMGSIDFPTYLFPTLVVLDAKPTMTPRVLVAGGLFVEANAALDPPAAAMEVISYDPKPGSSIVSVPVNAGSMGMAATGGKPWLIEGMTACSMGPDYYRSVAWNAATLLASADTVLEGERVLTSGGTPRNTGKCHECDSGSMAYTCGIVQASIASVPAIGSAAVALYQADPLQIGRFGHTQTLLADHTVLVAGGLNHQGTATVGVPEIEIYNPARVAPVPGAGMTGDADDPLKLELSALVLARMPGSLAGGNASPSVACVSPKKK